MPWFVYSFTRQRAVGVSDTVQYNRDLDVTDQSDLSDTCRAFILLKSMQISAQTEHVPGYQGRMADVSMWKSVRVYPLPVV